MVLNHQGKLLVAAAVIALLAPVLLTCERSQLTEARSSCYVYYQDGSPFGYVTVSDLGRRADARGPLYLTAYGGLFRVFDGADVDFAFKIITAAREDGRLEYIYYEDGLTECYVRVGEGVTVYTLVRDERVRSGEVPGVPAFFRVRGFFLPLPTSVSAGVYPRPFAALDLETGEAESVRCRSIGGYLILEFRGYSAKLVTSEKGYPRFWACTDGTVMTRRTSAPAGYLIAYRARTPALAIPFVVSGPAEITLPITVVLSRPVDPEAFGPGFNGECLGRRASGVFTVSVPAPTPAPSRELATVLWNASLPSSENPRSDDLYCAGLALTGGNLLCPVYWRESAGASEVPPGVIVLARAPEPTRVVSFELMGPPEAPGGAVYSLDNPSFLGQSKEVLGYTIYYRGDEVGLLNISYYEKPPDGNSLLRTVGTVLGKKVERFRDTSASLESGTAMRPFSLNPYNFEEFIALGAAVSGARPGSFPRGFFVPVHGPERFAPVKFSSVNFITIGNTGIACRVYNCGGTEVFLDGTGIPVTVERGAVRVVLNELPRRKAPKPEAVPVPSPDIARDAPEAAAHEEAIPE